MTIVTRIFTNRTGLTGGRYRSRDFASTAAPSGLFQLLAILCCFSGGDLIVCRIDQDGCP